MRHSDGLRAALAGSQGRDPNFKNTVLLLHGDGTNGAQNNTFVDGSTNNFTITRNGNTTQGSFSPYGDNWSNYFDGSGDYLTVPDNNALDVTTEDLTIECWIYVNAFQSSNNGEDLMTIIDKGGVQGSTNPNYQVSLTNSGGAIKLRGYFIDGATVRLSLIGSTTIQATTWYHVALVRNSSTGYIFLNGTQDATGTLTGNMSGNANPLAIGFTANAISRFYFNGYISNLRILKGTAQYTSNFTPPTTPLTAITNTSLLTCQSNRFRDNSTNAFAITRNGDVSVQRFSPFAPSAAYSTSAIGGSGYFDGTGDTLTTDATTAFDFANNNFTIEAWVYTTSFATGQGICANQDNGGVSTLDGWVFALNTDASISFQDWTNTTTVLNLTSSANVIRLNNWHHVVVEKRGTGTNQIQVFVDGVAVATGTRNANIPASTSNQPLTIGNWRYSPDTNREFTGYIADLRIVNSAVYNGTVTVPTAPLTAVTNTSLLCNFTNAGIFDNAMMNDLETVGNAQISTTQKKYGTGALYFDGSGDYLKGVPSNILVMSTGDFTIEFWVYIAARTSFGYVYASGAQANDIFVSFDTNGNFLRLTNSSTVFAVTSTLPLTTWTHIAVVRSSGSSKIYVDGTGGTAVACTIDFTATGPSVGASNVGNSPFNGYIDDLRITKGVARYTANFTPPNAPLADF